MDIVAHHLHEKFPYYNNGQLSACRAMLVCSHQLNSFAVEWGLDRMVNVDLNQAKTNNRILGEALEAYIGAYYLDACTLYGDSNGHVKVRDLCIELVDPLLEQMMKTFLYIRINEAVQEKKLQLRLQRIKGAHAGISVNSQTSSADKKKSEKKAGASSDKTKEKPKDTVSKESQKVTGKVLSTKKEKVSTRQPDTSVKLKDSGKSPKKSVKSVQDEICESDNTASVKSTKMPQVSTKSSKCILPINTPSGKSESTMNPDKCKETAKKKENSQAKSQAAKNESPKLSRVSTKEPSTIAEPAPKVPVTQNIKIKLPRRSTGVSSNVTGKRKNPHLPDRPMTEFKELTTPQLAPTVGMSTPVKLNNVPHDIIASHFTIKKPRLIVPTMASSKSSNVQQKSKEVKKELLKVKKVAKVVAGNEPVKQIIAKAKGSVIKASAIQRINVNRLIEFLFFALLVAVEELTMSLFLPTQLKKRQEDLSKLSIQELTSKNCQKWAQEYLKEKLVGLEAEHDGIVVKTTELSECSGDADLNQRKGKLIPLIDMVIELRWSGVAPDGTEAVGKIRVPELLGEDCEFEVSVDEETSAKEPIKEVVRNHITPLMSEKFKNLGKDMVETHSKDVYIEPSKLGTSTPPRPITPIESTGASIDQTVNPTSYRTTPKPTSTNIINSTTITDTVELQTSANQVYETLLDPSLVAAWTRSRPDIFKHVGSSFSLFDGNITGTIVELTPNEKIVQKWRLKTWPEGHFSTVTLKFEQTSDRTIVHVTQEGVPVGEEEIVRRNWQSYYWNSIKSVFGYGLISQKPTISTKSQITSQDGSSIDAIAAVPALPFLPDPLLVFVPKISTD
ncbi:4968_t:CDS:10 [Acaulospora colombiana]|uniref:4968_t:CDS:1 n=1 Tax=Acaulospora colombiana TaxID=27376 RepID=A0ACA9KM50_9GLOM|nr:4968_t:CDS:10 [Acaulospora colombiana]